LAQWLQEDSPPISFVSTGLLSYWQAECLHALVVVGIEEQQVFVHDPAFDAAPLTIPRDEVLAAWGELSHLAARLTITA